jgi:Fe-S cluster assembly iron-binding protein IscA
LALDEPKDDDKIHNVNEIDLLIDDNVLPFTRGNRIDYHNDSFGEGFSISSPAGSRC